MGCPVTVDCGSPPSGSTGTPYTHTFPTTGGPNLFFSITSGALPPGLELDPATGIVSGTPTAAGTYAFTVTVIDAQIMATGDDGTFSDSKIVITSDDGATWARQTTAISDSGYSVIYSEALGLWINGTDLASSTEQLQTSPDGVSGNWTAVSTPADGGWVKKLVSGPGQTVALFRLSSVMRVMTSPDGVVWTEQTLPAGVQVLDAADIAYSPDLDLYCIASATLSGNNGVLTSQDAVTWTHHTVTGGPVVEAIAWGNGLFVAVGGPQGSGVHLQTSPDGSIWTVQADPGGQASSWSGIHFANGMFVIVSLDISTNAGFQAATSTDGINWTIRATPTSTKRWACVSYGYGFWIAGAQNSANSQPLMTSTDDGVTWALVSALGFNFGFLAGIAFGPVDNCQDSANCSIMIAGPTAGNFWRVGPGWVQGGQAF